ASPGIPASGPGGVATFTTVANAQGFQVPISAAVEIQSTTGAFVVPRMTTAQRGALIVAEGMVVFDTDLDQFLFYQGGMWIQFSVNPPGGNVVGPGAAQVNAIALYGNGTGTQLLNSAILINATGTISQNPGVVNSEVVILGSAAATAAAPSYSFEGDTNTGMYRASAEHIGFAANGIQQFQVTTGTGNGAYLIATGGATAGFLTSGGVANAEVSILLNGVNAASSAFGVHGPVGTAYAGNIRLYEGQANGANYVGFTAPAAIGANVQWTLPSADGLNGQALVTNGAGILSFAAVAGNVAFTGPVPVATNIARYADNTGNLIEASPVTIDNVTGKITITGGNGGVINVDNGQASTASYGFVGDPDTGMWSSGAGTLDFDSNGTTQFRMGPLGGAINFITATGNTGNLSPTLSTSASTGPSGNIGLSIVTKGNSALEIHSDTVAGEIRFYETGGVNYVALQSANVLAANVTWTLPTADGTNGQVLSTNGAGTLAFSSVISAPGVVTDHTMLVFNGTAGAVFANSGVTVSAAGTIANATGSGTGQFIQSPGTIGVPSYTFVGDTDTGISANTAGTLDFSSNASREFQITPTAAANNWLSVTGAVNGSAPSMSANGNADADVSISLIPKGAGQVLNIDGDDAAPSYSFASTPTVGMYTDGTSVLFAGAGATQFAVGATAGAVDYVMAVGGNSGKAGFETVGTDADVDMLFLAKGIGGFDYGNVTNGAQLQIIDSGAPTTGWITIRGSATGAATTPTIGVAGSATDIDIVIETQGTAGLALANSTVGGTLALLNAGGTAACAITVDPAFVGEHNIQLPNITAPAGNYFIQATRVDAVNTTLSYAQPAIQAVSGQLSSAQIMAMEAAPISLVPAAGPNTVNIIQRVVFELAFNTTAYTAGGAVIMQYDNTAAGLGIAATNTTPATSITAVASTVSGVAGILTATALSNMVNKDIFISNQTAPFATGDSPVNYYIFYTTVTTT
ncbi:MAG TPA: hypothetical protein VGF75_07275, partial [Candidatus Saccharimonadales bacterium]